uniref:Odorant receptor n=2 Tax=Diabrotica virgifera virgifera TaxID=50390 RepID=A0A6P7FWH3_DIAVI
MSLKYGYAENFFKANDVVKYVAGLGRPGKNINFLLRFVYYLYVFFIYFIGFAFVVYEYMIFNEMLNNISKLLSYIGMCLTHTLGMIKLSIYVFFQRRVNKIRNNLQDDRFKYTSLNENGPSALYAAEMKISSTVAFLTLSMYGGVGASAHVSTVMAIDKETEGNDFIGNTTCYDVLPYYFVIPFPAETKGMCMLAATFMDIGFATWAFVISYYDGMFVAILRCLKVQLVIAGHVVVTLRQRCLKQLQLREDLELLHDSEKPELEQELHQELGHVIEHVKLLFEVRDDVESLFTFVTLIQTLCSLFIFASCMFVASIVPMTSPDFFAQMEFFLCVLVQLAVMCWSGNEITTAGYDFGQALYNSDWFSCSKRFKSSMVLTMIRMQRPIVLSIGKFTPLTITTLVNVCRGSFSYFAVFKSVK